MWFSTPHPPSRRSRPEHGLARSLSHVYLSTQTQPPAPPLLHLLRCDTRGNLVQVLVNILRPVRKSGWLTCRLGLGSKSLQRSSNVSGVFKRKRRPRKVKASHASAGPRRAREPWQEQMLTIDVTHECRMKGKAGYSLGAVLQAHEERRGERAGARHALTLLCCSQKRVLGVCRHGNFLAKPQFLELIRTKKRETCLNYHTIISQSQQ